MILDRTWDFLKAAKLEAIIVLVSLTALAAAIDLYDAYQGEESNNSIALNIGQLIAFYYLLLGIVRKNGLREGTITAGGTYFGIALLAALGTIFGFLLLIVPGVFLLIRWGPAYGYALVEGESVTQSFSSSMSDTAGHEWPILIAYLVPFGFYVIGLGALFAGYDQTFEMFEPFLILGNAVLYAGSVIFTAMGIAIFSLLNPAEESLTDVFE